MNLAYIDQIYIYECININIIFIQPTFGGLNNFQKLVGTLSNHHL